MSDTSSRRLGEPPPSVLDQLGATSWLPALTLVGALAVTTELRRGDHSDLPAALAAISRYSPGGFALLAAAVVVTAVLTQAFAFGAMAVVTGRWGSDRVSNRIATIGIAVESRRRNRVLSAIRATERCARAQAVAALADRPPADADAEDVCIDIVELFGDDWDTFARPATLRRLDRLRGVEEGFPDAHRILPTRLGNALRSYGDRVETGAGHDLDDLDAYVLRHRDDLTDSLLARHDRVRARLELYCTLEATFVLIAAVVAGALMPLGGPKVGAGAGLAACSLALAVLCSRAAMANAHDYGRTLLEIDALVRARIDITTPPEEGGPPEPDDEATVQPPPGSPGHGHDHAGPDVGADRTIVIGETVGRSVGVSPPRSTPDGSSRTRR